MSTDTIQCTVCQQYITKGAKKCTRCGSYQNRVRRSLHFSNTLLALLVAFISVTGVMVKPILDALRPDSEIHAAYFWSDSNRLALFVSNTGTRTGGVSRVTLAEGSAPPRTLRVESPRVIPPGGSQELLLFSADPTLPQVTPMASESAETCTVTVHVRNFSGKETDPQRIVLPCRSQGSQ